ncbi:conserved Plasmodium protein, unknown function [Plasmodium malariae]|uniref:Uncharacterized protein n=1 Tax=Plasmodium malariae TaxID=5858 RepID=A0A1A8VP07_PLAMA|nr:conserved Plasmodium protein, unknown function [Plasmodium malariae]SBS82121.1 conserved Plasmodium protein, unknown function [Plasmodium malariae]SBT86336.1 conserved Plasmodium protein, unknown function [Plasmodium malariae]
MKGIHSYCSLLCFSFLFLTYGSNLGTTHVAHVAITRIRDEEGKNKNEKEEITKGQYSYIEEGTKRDEQVGHSAKETDKHNDEQSDELSDDKTDIQRTEKENVDSSEHSGDDGMDEYFNVDVEELSLFPDPNELYDFLMEEKKEENGKSSRSTSTDSRDSSGNGSSSGSSRSLPRNKTLENLKGAIKSGNLTREHFLQLYKSALSHFDVDGYTFLMQKIMHKEYNERFAQKVKRLNESNPHCDKVEKHDERKAKQKRKRRAPNEMGGNNIDYPGGPVRSTYGNNLSKWMKDSLENIESPESIKEPGLANMLIQSLTMVKGLIQSVASSVVDIVPPLIPPPIWINRPLPCLPMVTGKNCLGSILYPITAAEFVTADITDSIMNGVISSFPAKYASKVGKTSDTLYRICAMAYLGMYCASIFPICWLPVGLRVSETMSLCFPQCLATLIACPGFWIDDIEGPCSNTSVPPFCSFSIFVNQKIVPPQLTSYDDSHNYPSTCPSKDDEYDIPDELYEHEKETNDMFLKEKKAYSKLSILPIIYPNLVPNLYNNKTKIHEMETCKCMDIIHLCKKHFAIPVIRNGNSVFNSTHEEPVKLSSMQNKCCKKCKPIWKILFPTEKKVDLRGSPVYPRRAKLLSGIVQR